MRAREIISNGRYRIQTKNLQQELYLRMNLLLICKFFVEHLAKNLHCLCNQTVQCGQQVGLTACRSNVRAGNVSGFLGLCGCPDLLYNVLHTIHLSILSGIYENTTLDNASGHDGRLDEQATAGYDRLPQRGKQYPPGKIRH